MTEKYIHIGDWIFAPGSKSLRHAQLGHEVKLEDKISALLQCLHNQRGRTVSKEELIEQVWQGRELSEQTIPVAISKLRKALNDDINRPKLLATVPRQGYQLIAEEEQGGYTNGRKVRSKPTAWAHFAAAAFAAAIAASFVWWLQEIPETNALSQVSQIPQPAIIVTVNDVRTIPETESLLSQAIATSELISYYLSQSRDIQVIRHWWNLDAPDPTGGIYTRYGEQTPIYSLKPNLILDQGRPAVTLVLSDPKTDAVIWSGLHTVTGGSTNLFSELTKMIQHLGVQSGIYNQTIVENDIRYWNARYFTHLSTKGAAYNAAEQLRALAEKPAADDKTKLLATGLAARWQPSETDTDAFTSLKPLFDAFEPKEALSQELDHSSYADYAAIALYRDADLETAEHLLAKALGLAPGDHHSLFLLGEVYTAAGQDLAAQEAYSRAYRLAPFARAYRSKLSVADSE